VLSELYYEKAASIKTAGRKNSVWLAFDFSRSKSTFKSSTIQPYRTWLDEDAQTGSVLVASLEDRFFAEIVELQRAHQMWTFLRSRYEPTGQSTVLVAIRQKQLLR
jgi:hypothetical protein